MKKSSKEIFDEYLKGQLNQESLQRLKEIQSLTRIRDNDALWLILIALESYLVTYQKIPRMISESAETIFTNLTKNLNEAANFSLQKSLCASHEYISKAISDISNKVVYKVAKESIFIISAAAVLISAFIIVMFFFAFGLGFSAGEKDLTKKTYNQLYNKAKEEYASGFKDGEDAGYKRSYDEKAAASWANTPEGRLSYTFSRTSQYSNLIKCDLPGWFIKDGFCYPNKAENGALYGWQLPR